MPEIAFFEQYEWDSERAAMKFWAKVDGNPVTCWIHEAALRILGNGEEKEKEKSHVELYMANVEAIQAIAERLIKAGTFDDKGEIVIDEEVCRPL